MTDDQVERRLESLEQRLRALETRFTAASEAYLRGFSELARASPGDPKVEWKEPFLPYLIDLAGLEPSHRILDIGCGPGELTAELAGYLNPRGSYTGMDVRADAIETLRDRYAAAPNFTFVQADLRNSQYNPDGAENALQYRFPADDASVELVVLRSVFTHMLPDEVAKYIEEIARVLSPGGRSFVTYFLINDKSRPYLDTRWPAAADDALYRVRHNDSPERAVALEEAFVRKLYATSGLRILEPIRYGTWCRRKEGLTRQDAIIAEHPES
jgi:ubiquinone/menaquinone biosynthesis C-methylase UbiE